MQPSVNDIADYQKAYSHLFSQLEHNLDGALFYHDAVHTRFVVQAAQLLAEGEGIAGDEKLLLVTAALFHDAGFLRSYKNHEEESCTLAQEILPGCGYSTSQIQRVCALILATKMPHRPQDHLHQIICDADLAYLGTDEYFPRAEKLYLEYRKQKLVKSRKEWQEKQVLFLSAHRFYTESAQRQYENKKQQHLTTLRSSHHRSNHLFTRLQDFTLMVAGVLVAGFALKGFLVPNRFFDGGITGISLLIHEVYHFNLAYAIIIFNLPLVVASYFLVSKRFALKTLTSVILLGTCLLLIPYPTITSDKLLISIFGGVFIGLGIGLVMRAGCALDGIEVLALYTLRRSSFTITEIILGINIVIFTIAAFRFGIETALYSVLTYFAASRMIDYVIEGIQAYTGVTIISGESEAIKYKLVNELGRGITVYKGERGFLPGKFEVSSECDIIFTVITRLELRKLKNLVYETDSKAFVFASTMREASGGIIKRGPNH
ncbi:MAG: hypothetical protein NVS1B13_03050 [Flavisolibacter sp.]